MTRVVAPEHVVRNPLTAALAAMALHATASLALAWPTPSVATFLAGVLAVTWVVFSARPVPRALGAALGLAAFAPDLLPLPVLAACLAAAASLGIRGQDPLRNAAIALPALTVLVLSMTA